MHAGTSPAKHKAMADGSAVACGRPSGREAAPGSLRLERLRRRLTSARFARCQPSADAGGRFRPPAGRLCGEPRRRRSRWPAPPLVPPLAPHPPCATMASLPRFAPPGCNALHVGWDASLRVSARCPRRVAHQRRCRARGQSRRVPAGTEGGARVLGVSESCRRGHRGSRRWKLPAASELAGRRAVRDCGRTAQFTSASSAKRAGHLRDWRRRGGPVCASGSAYARPKSTARLLPGQDPPLRPPSTRRPAVVLYESRRSPLPWVSAGPGRLARSG